MYECEEQKQHQKEHPTELSLCTHCTFFIHEADKCLEDSILTPVYRAFWNPDSKPPHFKDDGSKGKRFSLQINCVEETDIVGDACKAEDDEEYTRIIRESVNSKMRKWTKADFKKAEKTLRKKGYGKTLDGLDNALDANQKKMTLKKS